MYKITILFIKQTILWSVLIKSQAFSATNFALGHDFELMRDHNGKIALLLKTILMTNS